MVKVISDNSAAAIIKRIDYTQIGLTSSENDLLLSKAPKDEFVRATAKYQICSDHSQRLEKNQRPSLSKYMEGPFALAIYNHGDNIAQSVLIFELQKLNKPSQGKDIILDDPKDFTSMALAALPFVDIFKSEIEIETARSERLIQSSRVRNMQDVKANRDDALIKTMTHSFLSRLNANEKKNDTPVPTGKEAISDSLASSLKANNAFYNTLWQQMTQFFEPSFRYIGEQQALGGIALTSQKPIIV